VGLEAFKSENLTGGGTYLHSLGFDANVTTRSAWDFDLFYENEEFQGEKAELFGFGIEYPENDPYRNFGIGVTGGTVDGERYSLVGLSANYRFSNRITVTPSFQSELEGGERQTLGIIGLSYEIDRFRSIGGRAVIRDGESNWYLAYRQSGNLGVEWYVILGDPNADSFQRRLIVKAVIPLSLKF
jgi:hypothetical protein